jgi:hypothetical protein
MNPLFRLLQLWVSWVINRPRLVLAVAGSMAFASIVFTAARLELVTDQLELLAINHPLIGLSKTLDPFRMGGASSFAVVIQAPAPHRAVDFIGQLSSRIKEDKEHFQDVIVRIDPDSFKPWQLLYMDKRNLLGLKEWFDQHHQLVQGFSEAPELLGFLKLVNRQMSSQMVGELFTGFLNDNELDKRTSSKEPFDPSFLISTLEGLLSYLQGAPGFRSSWSSFFENAGFDPELAGYFWEADKRYLLAFVVPNSTESGFLGTRSALIRLRKLIQDTRVSFPDIQAGVTGQEALKIDEVSTVSHDMAAATWLSLVGVFALMVVFFRGFRRPFLQITTLITGLCWTFGWTTLFVGHLNILSVVFAPLLCGLGVDYGIHWLARIEEESFGNTDTRCAIARVTERSGPGIFLAALSGALCFLPLILTGFRGVVEMGMVTGMGIIFTLIATFSVLPALSIRPGGKDAKRLSRSASPTRRDLFHFNLPQTRFILAVSALISLLSIWGAGRVYFDPNPLRLQSANAESVIWEKTLIENAKRSPLFAAAFCSSPEEVRTKSNAFERLASVSQVETVFSVLPEDQKEKISLLHSLSRNAPDRKTIVWKEHPDDPGEFIDILERISFKMQNEQAETRGAEKPLIDQMTRVRTLVREIIELLRGSPGAEKSLLEYGRLFAEDTANKWEILSSGANASTMTIQDLPEPVRKQFLHDGTYLLRIFPKESIFEEHALDRFVRDIQRVDPQVIGSPVSFYIFANALKGACVKASIYAVIIIFIMLMLAFRSLRLVLPVIVPLVLGSLWTVGIMGWAGIQFNMANSIFMPLVVGAGVEYGVIILQRWREGSMLPGRLPFSTGKGVVLAALSTTIGFGALMVSRHRGIFSLGFVAWEGSLCVLLAAVIVLPAILTFMSPDRASEDGYLKDWADVICDRK